MSFLYLLARRLFEWLRVHRRDDFEKDAEILALRHQLSVLKRQGQRPRLTRSDRAFISMLAKLLPRSALSSFMVRPAAILAWHHRLVARRWTYPRKNPGRPPLPVETVELVLRLARENPRWGYMRIAGELKKLGVAVSATSVRNVLKAHGLPPAPRRNGPTWEQFIRAQARAVIATDFFSVESVFGSTLYVLFVIEVESRVVHLLGVTKHPVEAWVTQVARNFTSGLEKTGRSFRFLVRDRDTKFTRSFDAIFSAVGIEILKTPIRSPRANAYAERFVRTARTECLDHVLIVGRRHLERVVTEFVSHYDTARPHRGLELATPIPLEPTPPKSRASLRRKDVLGGIIHEYEWAA